MVTVGFEQSFVGFVFRYICTLGAYTFTIGGVAEHDACGCGWLNSERIALCKLHDTGIKKFFETGTHQIFLSNVDQQFSDVAGIPVEVG